MFFGAMSGGSLVWGQVASLLGVPSALLLAALGAALTAPLTWRAKLNQGVALDLAPSSHWPQPIVSEEIGGDRGPVMIQLAYRIAPADQARFEALMRELRGARLRGGGYGWSLMQDAADPTRFVETWFEASWLQHLRHHERVSGADKAVQDEIAGLHQGAPPAAAHYLAPEHGP